MPRQKKRAILFPFLLFWMYLLFFKFGGGLHYELLSPLGERVLPLWFVGLLMSIASMVQLVLDVPAGRLLDRFGYRKMLAVGTLLFMAAASLLFLQFSAYTLIASVLLASLGWLFFGPGRNAYALSHATLKNSETFMAYRDVFGSVGIVLSCLLLPLIVNSSAFTIGLVAFSLLAIAFFAICLSPRDTRKISHLEHVHEKTHHQRRYLFFNLRKAITRLNPPSSLLIILSFVGAIFYGVVWFVVPLIIANAPSTTGVLGIGLAMFDFAVVITGAFLYKFVNRADKKILVFFGLLLFSIGGMLLGVDYGLLFLLFAFLATTGDEVASLPLWAWLHQLDKNHNSDGLVSGIINLFEDLGWAAGPLFAGIMYSIIGPTWTIVLGAVPIFLMVIIYWAVVRKHPFRLKFLDVPRRPHKARHKG